MPIYTSEATRAALTHTQDFVNDQTFDKLVWLLGSASTSFTSDGIGVTSATSIIMLTPLGGFADVQIVSKAKYITDAQGAEDFGFLARLKNSSATAQTTTALTYYTARQVAGKIRISKSIDGTLSTLTESAWALAQNTYATYTFTLVGSAISFTAHDESSSLSDLTISVTDTSITSSGRTGMRTSSKRGFWANITVTQQ